MLFGVPKPNDVTRMIKLVIPYCDQFSLKTSPILRSVASRLSHSILQEIIGDDKARNSRDAIFAASAGTGIPEYC